jgi:periplasmic protein TonB
MRRDLFIGIVVSIAVHGGTAWIGELAKAKPHKRKAEQVDTIQVIQLPKIEPDEPETVDDTEKPVPIEFAPPQQMDVPQPTVDTSFVQPLQPPPPENVKIAKGQMIIPQGGTGWKSNIKIFDVSQLDQIPVATLTVRPNYPFEMRREGVSGEVVVEFIVDTTGTVRNAFAESSDHREFEAEAVRAVMKWKFKPGRKEGHVVNSRMQLPIVFKLNTD